MLTPILIILSHYCFSTSLISYFFMFLFISQSAKGNLQRRQTMTQCLELPGKFAQAVK